ncbi:MAG: hypothetical protein HY778_15740 [Betaproteobacteria bacterium]|nr:hypothetical protein [Betaproteobacteria bacterium]
MDAPTPNGATAIVDGTKRVFCDGYWIKAYDPPADSLSAKKRLIEALTRRLFNHVEHGINLPGKRLEQARHAFESEADPDRRRVKGAMLAGALFNRATDIFTRLVELQELGVEIDPSDGLMRECGRCLQEALDLGRMVRHRSGEESIDELWGEPFRAFSIPVEAFYDSRYIKIAQAMRGIDQITDALAGTLGALAPFAGIQPLVADFAAAARQKSETLRTDEAIVEVWTSFVVAGEHLVAFSPRLPAQASEAAARAVADGMALVRRGRELVSDIARARVSMPKSTREYIARLEAYHHAMSSIRRVARSA